MAKTEITYKELPRKIRVDYGNMGVGVRHPYLDHLWLLCNSGQAGNVCQKDLLREARSR